MNPLDHRHTRHTGFPGQTRPIRVSGIHCAEINTDIEATYFVRMPRSRDGHTAASPDIWPRDVCPLDIIPENAIPAFVSPSGLA